MKNKKNLIVIITTKGLNQNLKKVYKSLILQKYKPKKNNNK